MLRCSRELRVEAISSSHVCHGSWLSDASCGHFAQHCLNLSVGYRLRFRVFDHSALPWFLTSRAPSPPCGGHSSVSTKAGQQNQGKKREKDSEIAKYVSKCACIATSY